MFDRSLSQGTSWEFGDHYAPSPQNNVHVHIQRLPSVRPRPATSAGPWRSGYQHGQVGLGL